MISLKSLAKRSKTQWEAIGLKVETVAMATGKTWPEDGTADLVYVAAAVWEPITDARRVLGPDGLAKSKDQLIGLGFDSLKVRIIGVTSRSFT